MLKRTSIIAITALLLSCDEHTTSNTHIEKRGNAYELKVDARWQKELRRPLPELVIFNAQGDCAYHSAGFSKETFEREMQQVFFPEEPNELNIEEFAKDNPDLASKIANSVREALPDADNETVEAAIESSLEQVAEQQANPKNALLPTTCNASLSQNLAILQTHEGLSLAPYQLVENEHFTIIEYWADWCLPCKQQRNALENFLEHNKPPAVFLHVERDVTQSQ